MEDSRDYLINFLKEKYEYEASRKRYFDEALNLPVTLLSFLVAGLYFLITDDSASQYPIIKSLLMISILLSCLITFSYLFKVYFGFRRLYSSFPDSKTIIETDYNNLVERHSAIEDEELKEDYIISDLKDYTIHWYKDCNSENTNANDRRADTFYNSKISLAVSLFLGILLLVFICLTKFNMSKMPSTPPPPPTPVRREKSDSVVPRPQTKNT